MEFLGVSGCVHDTLVVINAWMECSLASSYLGGTVAFEGGLEVWTTVAATRHPYPWTAG